MHQSPKALTRLQAISYSLPMFAFSFLVSPVGFMLQGIYAKHFGVALTTIASVLLLARLFDAITDPIIGYCSDRYYTRCGSHKPFMIAGSLLFIISSWFLYVPFGADPTQEQANVTTVYFLICLLAFYLTQTILEISHLSWGSELASNSRDKNTVYGMRTFLGLLGAMPFFAIPLLPWFESTEFTPQTLQWSAAVGGSLMLVMLYFCIRYTPDRLDSSTVKKAHQSNPKEELKVVVRSILGNTPFLVFAAAHIFTGLGSGMLLSLLFIFVDAYLGLGSKFAHIFLIATCLKLVFLRFWVMLANRWGKQAAWIVGMVLATLGTIGTGLLSPQETNWIELLVCATLIFFGFTASFIAVPSLLSDIIDYGTWKFGTNRTSTYFSLYLFMSKSASALGAALALALAGWFGFDPASQSHSDTAIKGLHLAMVWIPLLFFIVSIVFINRIPITSRRHAIIRRRLDDRDSRAVKLAQDRGKSPVANDKTTSLNQSHHLAKT